MKKTFYIIMALAAFFTSCEEETADLSKVTVYPSFTMEGERYVSVIQGETYSDPGVTAKEGETDLEVNIAGSVDPSEPGIYNLVYKAVNQDGFEGEVTRTVAVLPGHEEPGLDISGTYAYAAGGGASQITKLNEGLYLTTNVYSPASPMSAYLICVDGENITVPLSSLSVYGPIQGTAILGSDGSLVYTIDVLDFGIVGSTRNWKKSN